MKLLAFNGSPRKNGNTVMMLQELVRGAESNKVCTETINLKDIHLLPCKGCLRYNLIKRCAIRNDDWTMIQEKILDADVLVFASPIYFRHVTTVMKALLDRFRSFIHVGIGENDLAHTPWHVWQKQMIVLLCMGSPDPSEAKAVVELFEFIGSILGKENHLKYLMGTRLAVAGQVGMSKEKLIELYKNMEIPERLADADHRRNQSLLNECFSTGKALVL